MTGWEARLRLDLGRWEEAADRADEALALARRTAELQRLAPVAAARAEARWLAGEPDAAARETGEAVELARRVRDGRALAELLAWRPRACAPPRVEADV